MREKDKKQFAARQAASVPRPSLEAFRHSSGSAIPPTSTPQSNGTPQRSSSPLVHGFSPVNGPAPPKPLGSTGPNYGQITTILNPQHHSPILPTGTRPLGQGGLNYRQGPPNLTQHQSPHMPQAGQAPYSSHQENYPPGPAKRQKTHDGSPSFAPILPPGRHAQDRPLQHQPYQHPSHQPGLNMVELRSEDAATRIAQNKAAKKVPVGQAQAKWQAMQPHYDSSHPSNANHALSANNTPNYTSTPSGGNHADTGANVAAGANKPLLMTHSPSKPQVILRSVPPLAGVITIDDSDSEMDGGRIPNKENTSTKSRAVSALAGPANGVFPSVEGRG